MFKIGTLGSMQCWYWSHNCGVGSSFCLGDRSEEGCIGGRFFECYQRFNGGREAAGTNGLLIEDAKNLSRCFDELLYSHTKRECNVCWGLFFRPMWHYFIGNPCHIKILLIFWVNLFKTQNKLISHSTTWIWLTWLARSLLQEVNSWSTFPLHQLGS